MASVPALSENGKDRPHLQVLVGGARIAATPSAGRPGARAEQGRDAKFREIYERWFDNVVG